jgi:hypothetical protein
MGFPKGASIPFAKLPLAAGFKPRSRFELTATIGLYSEGKYPIRGALCQIACK